MKEISEWEGSDRLGHTLAGVLDMKRTLVQLLFLFAIMISGSLSAGLAFGQGVSVPRLPTASEIEDAKKPNVIVSLHEVPEAFPDISGSAENVLLAHFTLYYSRKPDGIDELTPLIVKSLRFSTDHNLPLSGAFSEIRIVRDLNENEVAEADEPVVGVATFNAAENFIEINDLSLMFGEKSEKREHNNFLEFSLVADLPRLLNGQYFKMFGPEVDYSVVIAPDRTVSITSNGKQEIGFPPESEFIPVTVRDSVLPNDEKTPVWHQVGSIPPQLSYDPQLCEGASPRDGRSGSVFTFTVCYTDRDGNRKDVGKGYQDFPFAQSVQVGLDFNSDTIYTPDELFELAPRTKEPKESKNVVYSTSIPVFLRKALPNGGLAYRFFAADGLQTPATGPATDPQLLDILAILFAKNPTLSTDSVLPGEFFEAGYQICYLYYNGAVDLSSIPSKLGPFTRIGEPVVSDAHMANNAYDCAQLTVRLLAPKDIETFGDVTIPQFPLDALQLKQGLGPLKEAAYTPPAKINVAAAYATVEKVGVPYVTVGDVFTVNLSVRHIPGVTFPADPATFLTSADFEQMDLLVTDVQETPRGTIENWQARFVVSAPPGAYVMFEKARIAFEVTRNGKKFSGNSVLSPLELTVVPLLAEGEGEGATVFARDDPYPPHDIGLNYFTVSNLVRTVAWALAGLFALLFLYPILHRMTFIKSKSFEKWKAYRKWKRALRKVEFAENRRPTIRGELLKELNTAFRTALIHVLGMERSIDPMTSVLERTIEDKSFDLDPESKGRIIEQLHQFTIARTRIVLDAHDSSIARLLEGQRQLISELHP